MILQYAWRLVIRNPRRTFTYLFGLALAVGLFAGILFFVDATTPDVNVADAAPVIAAQRSISAAEPVFSADFASAVKAGTTQATPAGRMFAVSPSYLQTFDILQISDGKFDPQGVMISEAMAVSQHLKAGDALQFTFSGVDQPVSLPVSGIVNMGNAEVLFATSTEAENAIVADVVFVDSAWFQTNLGDPLAALAANPPASLAPGAVILDPQVHVKIDRAQLPADPTLAAYRVDALRRSVERQFPGQLKAVDNLSGALKAARGDVLSAKILFIFLGLPGVALAAYLSKFAAELFTEAQRREISLLRTRGAKPSQVTSIVALTSVFLAIGGSILGLLFGLALLFVSGGQQVASTLNPFASRPGFDWGAFARSASLI